MGYMKGERNNGGTLSRKGDGSVGQRKGWNGGQIANSKDV